MIITEVRCDRCHKSKMQTNHWFMVAPDDNEQPALLLVPFSDNQTLNVRHLCGEKCVLAEVQQWMAKQGGKK